jgi:hypothetical protein
MIENEKQLRVTKEQIRAFESALAAGDKAESANIHPLLIAAGREAIKSELTILYALVREWEAKHR